MPALAGAKGLDQVAGVATRSFRLFLAQGRLLSDTEGTGRANHALMLDCRSLQFDLVPIPASVRLVVCNTGVKHNLAGREYNRRREECQEGGAFSRKGLPGIRVLRDVSLEQLEEYRGLLSEVAYKRAHHVIAENARVLDGMEALRMGSLLCTNSANIWPNHTGACATYLK